MPCAHCANWAFGAAPMLTCSGRWAGHQMISRETSCGSLVTFHPGYITFVSLVVHSLKSDCHGTALRLVTSPASRPFDRSSFFALVLSCGSSYHCTACGVSPTLIFHCAWRMRYGLSQICGLRM